MIRLPDVHVRAGVAHEWATYRAVEWPGHGKEDHMLPTAMAGSSFDGDNQRPTVRDRGSARQVELDSRVPGDAGQNGFT